MQTPIIAKRKAPEAIKKTEFEIPAPKRAKYAAKIEATPLRDQMSLNQDHVYQEAWEKSSIASGYSSFHGTSQIKVDIKASLSALPAPIVQSDSITDD